MRSHQTFHNALINTASWIFSIVIGFVFLPYIVTRLGTETYGVLVLVLAVIGYCAVLDLNLGDAVIKYIAEYRAENDIRQINAVVGSVISIFLIVGLVAGFSIYSLSHLLASTLLKIPVELRQAARSAFMIGAVGIFFTMILSALSAIPNGVNRYDITSKMTMAMGVATNIGTVAVLYTGYGLKEIVVLNVGITLLGILSYYFINRSLIPGLVQKPTYDAAAVRNVLNFGLYSSLSRLAGILQFQGVRILVGALLGGASVTFYVVPFTLISRAMTITSRLGSVIFPVVSGLQGKRDLASILQLYAKASRLILTISTAICLPLLLFGDRFIELWMGADFGRRTGVVMVVLCITLYVDSFSNIPSIVVNGLGRPKITGLFSAANAALNLALVFPLSKAMGIDGIAVSFLTSQLIIAPLFVRYVNSRVLGVSTVDLVRRAYLPPLIAAVLTTVPALFLRNVRIDAISSLMAVMSLVSVTYLSIAYVIGVFSREEKAQFFEYVQSVLKKPQPASTGTIDS